MTTAPLRPIRQQCGQRSCQVRDRLRHGRSTKYVDASPFRERAATPQWRL